MASTCRLVWIADLLPNDVAEAVSGMIVKGFEVMKLTLESQ